MTKKRKQILLIIAILLTLTVLTVFGMKFFPFSKLIKLPSGDIPEMTGTKTTGQQAPNSLYYDFEMTNCEKTPGGFYKGIAHSGEFSVKAFGKNSFSYAIEKTASQVGLKNLQAVALSAWIYVFPTEKEVKGSFVFTASNNLGVNLCWKGVYLVEPEVPRSKWFKISGYFDLKDVQFQSDTKMQIYFWNTSNSDILIDDYFIAFGGPVDRRGDSALIDLTRPGGYQPRFNYPPFPISYIDAVDDASPLQVEELAVGDMPVAGNFFAQSIDGLLIFKNNGAWTAYTSCQTQQGKMLRQGKGKLAITGSIRALQKGRFKGDATEQLVVQTENKMYLFNWNAIADPCQSGPALQPVLMTTMESRGSRICAGCFTGQGRTELLMIRKDGSSRILILEDNRKGQFLWGIKASPENSFPVDSPDSVKFTTMLHSGRFLKTSGADQILAITRSVEDNNCSYNLFRYNNLRNRWESVLKNPAGGLTIGIDTLKPEDEFFVPENFGPSSGHFSGLPSNAIFRYNRDWRFDLKIISFNDSSFTIHKNIDFRGYPMDQNPKYYESLWLIAGAFNDKNKPAFLVAGKNSSAIGIQKILPDFTRYYEITTKK
jgi:hypothetical protein